MGWSIWLGINSITFSPYISLACIIFTQPRAVRVGNFETCPWVKCRRCSQGSNALHWAVDSEILCYVLCNYMVESFVADEKVKLLYLFRVDFCSNVVSFCRVFMKSLTKHLLVLIVQTDVKISFLWCRTGWSGFRYSSCYVLINTYSSLQKHAEIYISCIFFLFLQVSIPPLYSEVTVLLFTTCFQLFTGQDL